MQATYASFAVEILRVHMAGRYGLNTRCLKILVITRSLQHENVNHFLGLVTEPQALVFVEEYQPKGSVSTLLSSLFMSINNDLKKSLIRDITEVRSDMLRIVLFHVHLLYNMALLGSLLLTLITFEMAWGHPKRSLLGRQPAPLESGLLLRPTYTRQSTRY